VHQSTLASRSGPVTLSELCGAILYPRGQSRLSGLDFIMFGIAVARINVAQFAFGFWIFDEQDMPGLRVASAGRDRRIENDALGHLIVLVVYNNPS
jgi:hypothetical protein